MTAITYERLRKQLIDRSKYKRALETYSLQKTFLPDKNTGEFWDEQFSLKNEKHLMETWRNNYVVSMIPDGSKVLNLGVGSGRFEEKLIKSNKKIDYVGTDITSISLSKLKDKFKQYNYEKAHLDDLPFSDESFDIVILLEVLEHIRPNRTFRVLSEIFRVLKSNGTFIISVPLNEGLELMLPKNPNSHQRFYSEKLLTFELIQSGFEIKSIKKVSAFRNLFLIKNLINDLFAIRQPNNLLISCQKK